MEMGSSVNRQSLEAFAENLKNLEQAYKDGTTLNSELPYLRIDGLEGILSHGIFGQDESFNVGSQVPNESSKQELIPEPNKPLNYSNITSEDSQVHESQALKDSQPGKKAKKIRVYPSNLEKHFKCGHCSFATHNKYNLENHLLRHADPTTSKVYKCDDCSYSSIIKRNVDRHAKKHKTGSSLKCNQCDFETVQVHEFKRHQHTHYQVDISDGLVKNEAVDINSAKETDAAETFFKCDQCLYTCDNIRYLKKHKINQHKKVKVYRKCDLCDFQTAHKWYLIKHKEHMHSDTDIKLHACPKCPFTSKYRTCILKHQKVHLSEEGKATIYQCYNCSFHSIHKGSLIKHMPVHRKARDAIETVFWCSICPYNTNRKDALARHQNVHLNDSRVYQPRVYRCKTCRLQLKSKAEWSCHVDKCGLIEKGESNALEMEEIEIKVETVIDDNESDGSGTQN